MSKAVFFCVGTGGHVLPVINIIKTISKKGIDKSDMLVITDKRGEQYFSDSSVEIVTYPFISSSKGIFGYFLKIFKILLSVFVIFRRLRNLNISFIFTTGAYIAPVAATLSIMLRTKFYIQEQNIFAGLGNKVSAFCADSIFTSFPDTENISQKKIDFSGPVLNLDVEKSGKNMNSNLTIGFQGGSQGSKEINDLAIKFANDPTYANIEIVHIVGNSHKATFIDRANYVSYGFIDNMDNYYNSIDIQVSRAGGGTLEAAFLNIPQLLVPYKHGTTSQHQVLNAQFLENKGAAKIITSYEELKTMLNSYLDDDLSKLEFNIKAGNDHIAKVLTNEIN
tara:strand:+ start:1007 stop:2014 length:1008 start_codon:yes stop_codon:yes gene_type:complete